MSQQEFFKHFIITILIAGGISALMVLWPPLSDFTDFAVIGMLFFSGLSYATFSIGKFLANQPNKMLFSYFTMFIILFKLIAAIGIVWGYKSMIDPPNKNYILIFIVHYLIFTILEVKVLMKLSKEHTV